jgi:hypothetical protein
MTALPALALALLLGAAPLRGAPVLPSFHLLPGVWFPAPPAAAGTVRAEGSRLTLRGFTAVELDAPLAADDVSVSLRLTPVVGSRSGMSWLSVMLTPQPHGLGWVNGEGNRVGLLVRSNGEVALQSHGREVAVRWAGKPPPPAESYAVWLRLRAGTLEGAVNDARFTADVAGPSGPLWLGLGAHFHPEDRREGVVEVLQVGR